MSKTAKTVSAAAAAEHKIEEFAEDLGRILGNARAKAEGWMGQRKAIVEHLSEIRDTASKLLSDLGHQAEAQMARVTGRRGRPAGSKNRTTAEVPERPAGKRKPGRRKGSGMSIEARAKIAAAQRARWARQKAGAK